MDATVSEQAPAAAGPADAAAIAAAPRLLLLYPHGFDAERWRAAHAAGRVAEASHWGMHQAAQLGLAVASSTDAARGPLARLVLRASHWLLKWDLPHVWANRRAIAAADMVWAMSERELLPLLVGRALGALRRPVLCGEAVWLGDDWDEYGRLRRWLVRRLLRRADGLLVITEGCAAFLREQLPGVVVATYRFGVPVAAFADLAALPPGDQPGTDRPIRVLAAGNDLRRDWQTVAQAFGGDPRFEVTLLTKRTQAKRYEAFGANIVWQPAGPYSALRDWYRWADVAVIASRPCRHAAGATMLLEAVAAGLPVVAADVGHIDELLPADCVTLVPPGDPVALREATAALLGTPGAAAAQAKRARAAFAARQLDSLRAVERRVAILRRLLQHRQGAASSIERRGGYPPAASAPPAATTPSTPSR